MTDILAGINFAVGFGWLAIVFMAATHLIQKFRFTPELEWAAVRRLLVIALFSAWEKITISLLATPSNLENAANLSPWIYVVAIGGRVGTLLAVWELVRWVWFDFWADVKGGK